MRDDKSTAKPAKTNLTWKVSSVASKSEDLNHAFGLTLLKATLNQIRICKSSVETHGENKFGDYKYRASPANRRIWNQAWVANVFESNAEPNSNLQIQQTLNAWRQIDRETSENKFDMKSIERRQQIGGFESRVRSNAFESNAEPNSFLQIKRE